jgi:hypothetical protein
LRGPRRVSDRVRATHPRFLEYPFGQAGTHRPDFQVFVEAPLKPTTFAVILLLVIVLAALARISSSSHAASQPVSEQGP